AESDFRPLSLDLDLRAGTHGALVAVDLEFLAIANQRYRRLWGTAGEQGCALGLDEGCIRCICADRGEQGEPSGAGCQIDGRWKLAPGVRKIQAPNIARAHRGIPGGPDLARAVSGDAVIFAVVEQDLRIGDASH